MNQYDLIVIGAGPGGYVAALRAAKLGARVAVLENREPGGTCLNRGCIPTKAMLHSSQVYHDIRCGGPCGISAENVRIDMDVIMARTREITAKLSAGVEALLRSAKIDLFYGKGVIVAPGAVQVAGEQGPEELSSDKILVATGSVPARPPIPGLELPGVLTSDDLLRGARLYDSLIIMGGGVIGVEFATFYNDLGCKVTILEGLDRLLPTMDRELGQNLGLIMKRRGAEVVLNAMVQSVEQRSDGLCVSYDQKGKAGFAIGQDVLCAIGRKPYLEGLFGPGLSPAMDGPRLKVDADFQTSIPGVYAIGDVSSKIQLAHVASAQGTACAEALFGEPEQLDLSLVPGCVYCRPEIAAVGMTEAEAKDAGIPVKTGKGLLSSNARNLIIDGDRSFIKLVAHTESGQLLGAHLMCERSSDMISELAQAIANRMTADQLLRAMRPHPTFEESVSDALLDLRAKLRSRA